MTRQLISSGSSFEEVAGYSRAVRQDPWVFVSGTSGFKDGQIADGVVAQAEQCIATIAAALEQGLLPLKLNTVVVRGFNDQEVDRLLEFAIERNCEVRFIELMPIGPGAQLFADGFVSSNAVRQRLSSRFALAPADADPGISARRYLATDEQGRRGTVGFISSCSAPFCRECSRLRVTADGRLIGCLARSGGIPVRGMLRVGDTQSIYNVVRRVLEGKTAERVFEQGMAMAAIGG